MTQHAPGARTQAMHYTALGRTGLNVSVACLGCGGGSALGLRRGKSTGHAVSIVRQAIDLGVNFIDTAHGYGTEAAVGQAINAVPRDQVVVSTKHNAVRRDHLYTPDEIVAGLDQSLRNLATDYIDVFHLHAVASAHYDHAMSLVPALLRERDKGKFRFLGITETGPGDPTHATLSRAIDTDCFDVVMLAFSLMNQNAKRSIFPRTGAANIATMLMFVVRSLFSVPGRLQSDIAELVENGGLPASFSDTDDPLGFLVHNGGASSVIDACYRYARHTVGCDTVLFGTGNPDHVAPNIASIVAPPLPPGDIAKIEQYFGHLEGVGLDLPAGKQPKTR